FDVHLHLPRSGTVGSAILPRMEQDVVVVGGGAIGVCCALELARRRARVTLLERGSELAAGASSGNAGVLAPSHSSPIANPTALRTGLRSMWRDSPFSLRRPTAAPWLVRFAAASRGGPAARGTRVRPRAPPAAAPPQRGPRGAGPGRGVRAPRPPQRPGGRRPPPRGAGARGDAGRALGDPGPRRARGARARRDAADRRLGV